MAYGLKACSCHPLKHGESWTSVCFIILFSLFESESWPRKTNQFGESLPNFIFTTVNRDPTVLEKRWTDGESWPNDFVVKVNIGEDLRGYVKDALWWVHKLASLPLFSDIMKITCISLFWLYLVCQQPIVDAGFRFLLHAIMQHCSALNLTSSPTSHLKDLMFGLYNFVDDGNIYVLVNRRLCSTYQWANIFSFYNRIVLFKFHLIMLKAKLFYP